MIHVHINVPLVTGMEYGTVVGSQSHLGPYIADRKERPDAAAAAVAAADGVVVAAAAAGDDDEGAAALAHAAVAEVVVNDVAPDA